MVAGVETYEQLRTVGEKGPKLQWVLFHSCSLELSQSVCVCLSLCVCVCVHVCESVRDGCATAAGL